GGVAFGTKCAVLRPGELSVGDQVIVGSWGEPEL
ncbi:MOSC domain-containing protein, partial [Streptomyces sp. NPDC088178]